MMDEEITEAMYAAGIDAMPAYDELDLARCSKDPSHLRRIVAEIYSAMVRASRIKGDGQ